MKATHWTCNDDSEGWTDNPSETPELAVEMWLADRDDAAYDVAYEVMSGPRFVDVYGYIETDAPLSEDDQFDGYEPGQKYFAPTRDTVRVEVSLQFRVVPADAAIVERNPGPPTDPESVAIMARRSKRLDDLVARGMPDPRKKLAGNEAGERMEHPPAIGRGEDAEAIQPRLLPRHRDVRIRILGEIRRGACRTHGCSGRGQAMTHRLKQFYGWFCFIVLFSGPRWLWERRDGEWRRHTWHCIGWSGYWAHADAAKETT